MQGTGNGGWSMKSPPAPQHAKKRPECLKVNYASQATRVVLTHAYKSHGTKVLLVIFATGLSCLIAATIIDVSAVLQQDVSLIDWAMA